MNRRSWLRAAAGLLVAPAIVRAESIMRVRPIVGPDAVVTWAGNTEFFNVVHWVRPEGGEWRLLQQDPGGTIRISTLVADTTYRFRVTAYA